MVVMEAALLVAVVGLLLFLFLRSSSKKSSPPIPGMQPSSQKEGNHGDISKAGSLHQFLVQLHAQFGPLASFWWGRTRMVSICEETLFRQHTTAFNRPYEMFDLFMPLLGARSLEYANGDDGKSRRKVYDRVFTHGSIRKYIEPFQEAADDIVRKWTSYSPGEHVPVCSHMTVFALRSVLASLFGKAMSTDQQISQFRKIYETIWNEKLVNSTDPNEQERQLQEGKQELSSVLLQIFRDRKRNPPRAGEELFLDVLMEYTEDEEVQFCDALVYTIGGFHTAGNLLSWALYYLAQYPDIQERVYAEIRRVLGDQGNVDHTNVGEFQYVKQVLDETLRCAIVVTLAGRFMDEDVTINGYVIPKNTPVIHAIGVACLNEKVFPHPEVFDPERFSPDKTKKRGALAFIPFGFAGKRSCPGQKFAYAEATTLVVALVRHFRLRLVPGLNIKPVHGLITHPNEEIYVTIEKR
ncbi:cytochrome P450 20A1-like [Dreissena polymorpha]|uniref:Cytochrome P450 n=1 Tax=Dreissena polymorpha TaxID=45954 RepID=A0A9D4C515_DREPO|nr:cytochrome P450 20A1-like [Dreissena polymorpha]KAH3717277.1 hypothetical protein DPMN_060059 [Dreissena polymorpha]